MRHLKPFIAFAFPLIIMLFMFSIYLLVNYIVDDYKKSIVNDYSIIVISNIPMVKIDNLAGIKVQSIDPISREKIIKDIQDNLSDSSIKLLKSRLPYFYKIYLNKFPTTLKLEQIRKELSTITSIKRVETFSKDHNKIYSLLILIQNIVFILFLVVLILSILLLSKQIKIWFYEHEDRITIIQLHGGTLLYSSIPILKTIVYSAIVSSIIVYIVLFLVASNLSSILAPEITMILPPHINIGFEIIKIIILAFVIPIVTFIGLLVRYKFK